MNCFSNVKKKNRSYNKPLFANCLQGHKKSLQKKPESLTNIGGEYRNRTDDLLHAMQTL